MTILKGLPYLGKESQCLVRLAIGLLLWQVLSQHDAFL